MSPDRRLVVQQQIATYKLALIGFIGAGGMMAAYNATPLPHEASIVALRERLEWAAQLLETGRLTEEEWAVLDALVRREFARMRADA